MDNKQILGLGFGILISLWLLMSGYYTYLGIMWMIVLPAILYLAPRIAKVRDLKHMIAGGVIFAVVAILAGGLFLSPGSIHDHDGFKSGNGFENGVITTTATGYSVTVDYTGPHGDKTPMAFLVPIDMAGYYMPYGQGEGLMGTVSGTSVSFDFDVDDRLYLLYFYLGDDDGRMIQGSKSPQFYLTMKTSEAELSKAAWKETVYVVSIIVILYFMITLFTYAIRSRANKARDRMIEQGRLYPSGYGRCKHCDAIVLPGEINCLKCNSYIDVPKELRPAKVDYFECEACGAEVPEDADKCPKCGVDFEELEVEVRRADGSVEIIRETFDCPECRLEVPMSSKSCPYCGKRFRK